LQKRVPADCDDDSHIRASLRRLINLLQPGEKRELMLKLVRKRLDRA